MEGRLLVSSASYINYQGAQTPDNYLVTPELSLANGGTLTFWVCAQDANYASEHYAVYASSTGNDAANFTNALLEETLTAKSVVTSPEAIRGTRAQGTWYQKTVQLPAGTKYVAFRHFNCTDFFWINLDDIEIKANAKRSELLNENFEGDDIPAGWTALDADGDGNNWGVELNQFTGRDREALAPLRASNVAISYSSLPQPGGGYVALTGANFTREKDLPDGTKYVAFRHYNCTDVLAIVIDDVVITGEGGTSVDYTYTVYRDGTKIKEGLTATTFEEEGVAPGNHEYCVEVKYAAGTKIKEGLTATTFEEEGVAPGNHEYCVEVKYAAGVSPKKCVNVTVDPQQFNPVQNLTAEQAPNSMDAILKWNAPASKRAEVV
ncbi:choice-of-anchor J domain-containing protein, partial [Porphyromonas gulae]|uniref:choice-of-anchor J domain-containing protein n=1 Tax=Porphyromonas gulae TaxID=111105 RepID=UPI00052C0F75